MWIRERKSPETSEKIQSRKKKADEKRSELPVRGLGEHERW